MNVFRSTRTIWLGAAAIAVTFGGVPQPAMAKKAKVAKFTDQCAELRKPFNRIKNYRRDKAVQGAVVGGFLGLATGLAVNSGKQNKGSVLPYVVAGAAAGGVIGYVAAKAEQAKDREEVQRAIATDFSGEVDVYDPMASRIADLGNCRREQIYSVQRDYESQIITDKDARARLVQLESWVTQDDQAISGAANVQSERVAYYVRAQRLAEGARPEDIEADDANIALYDDPRLRPAIQVTQEDAGTAVAAPEPMTTLYVNNKSGVNLREQPTTSGKKLGTIPYRSETKARQSTTQGWYEVEWNNLKGFSDASLFGSTLPPVVRPKAKGVRKVAVRKPQADTSSPKGQVSSAVAGRNAAQQTRVRSASETSAQLMDLRSALT